MFSIRLNAWMKWLKTDFGSVSAGLNALICALICLSRNTPIPAPNRPVFASSRMEILPPATSRSGRSPITLKPESGVKIQGSVAERSKSSSAAKLKESLTVNRVVTRLPESSMKSTARTKPVCWKNTDGNALFDAGVPSASACVLVFTLMNIWNSCRLISSCRFERPDADQVPR